MSKVGSRAEGVNPFTAHHDDKRFNPYSAGITFSPQTSESDV